MPTVKAKDKGCISGTAGKGWENMAISELERKTIEEIKRLSAREAVSIRIDPKKKPQITDSKFGGVPYWDMGMDYPKAGDGKSMMLLAQINLDELNKAGVNPGDRLPGSGMLQFFIALDDVYGMNFDGATDSEGRLAQDNFRVVYHKTVDYAVSREEIKSLGMPDSASEELDESPVWGEYGLAMEKKETYVGMDDYRFEAYFRLAAEAAGWEESERSEGYYNSFSEEGRDVLFEELEPSGHWMLGYPYFTQYDPREEDDKAKQYDVQLFQMDSDYGEDGDFIMWGDAGVANFFISEENLASEDFRDVLYSWDCC